MPLGDVPILKSTRPGKASKWPALRQRPQASQGQPSPSAHTEQPGQLQIHANPYVTQVPAGACCGGNGHNAHGRTAPSLTSGERELRSSSRDTPWAPFHPSADLWRSHLSPSHPYEGVHSPVGFVYTSGRDVCSCRDLPETRC